MYGPNKLDLFDVGHWLVVVSAAFSGEIGYFHFALPCETFSQALRGRHRLRSSADPVGPESVPKIRNANLLVRRIALLCKLLGKMGIFWSIENPHDSLLWVFPEILELRGHGIEVVWDMCVFGAVQNNEAYRKRTRLLTNFHALAALNCRCQSNHKHVPLKGKFKDQVTGKWVNRTKLAGAYPWSLCKEWALLAKPFLKRSKSKALANWKRLWLIWTGIEPHPGPSVRPTGGDLFVDDVIQDSADRYSRAVEVFELWLAVRDMKSIAHVCAQSHLVEQLNSSRLSGSICAAHMRKARCPLRRRAVWFQVYGAS